MFILNQDQVTSLKEIPPFNYNLLRLVLKLGRLWSLYYWELLIIDYLLGTPA